MKKYLYVLAFVFICFQANAQSKEDELDMNDFKHLFEKLKTNKIDVKTELSWCYSYLDASKEKLEALIPILEKEGLKVEELKTYNRDIKKMKLTVYETKVYTMKEYYARVMFVNSIVKQNGIENYQAIIGAEKPEAIFPTYIETYKKVGVEKKRE